MGIVRVMTTQGKLPIAGLDKLGDVKLLQTLTQDKLSSNNVCLSMTIEIMISPLIVESVGLKD